MSYHGTEKAAGRFRPKFAGRAITIHEHVRLLYCKKESRRISRHRMNRGIPMLEQILATLEDLRDRVEVAQERL